MAFDITGLVADKFSYKSAMPDIFDIDILKEQKVEQKTIVQNVVNVASETAASDVWISDKELDDLVKDL